MSDYFPIFDQHAERTASLPVEVVYLPDDEPTERLIPVHDPVEELRDIADALAKVMARIEALEARIDAAEGDGR